jgi:ribosomal subunit interface protein
MEIPLQITTRDIPESAAVEARIREKVAKLNRFSSHIISCRVVIDVPEKRKHQGKLFNVRIDIAVPGKELVVKRDLHEDLYVAIRDAFDAMTRQLEDHTRIQRGEVKVHQETLHGKIRRIFADDNYGFIETADGEEFYFQASNILTFPFGKLKIGDKVEFLPIIAGDGLQAGHVKILRND